MNKDLLKKMKVERDTDSFFYNKLIDELTEKRKKNEELNWFTNKF